MTVTTKNPLKPGVVAVILSLLALVKHYQKSDSLLDFYSGLSQILLRSLLRLMRATQSK